MSSNEWCPLPDRSKPAAGAMLRMLGAKRIAVVGLSDDPSRPSFGVASYLVSAGKEIVPINPAVEKVMGLKSYASLEEAPAGIELVNVFRRAEFCPDIVRSAAKIGVKGVWLQSGIISRDSEKIASEAGIDFVQNKCLMVEFMQR